jgi:hypothetical protein
MSTDPKPKNGMERSQMKEDKRWYAISLETLLHVMEDLNDRGRGRLIQNVCKDSQTMTLEELIRKYPFMIGKRELSFWVKT